MDKEKRHWTLHVVMGVVLFGCMLVAAGVGVIPIPVKVVAQSIGQKLGLCMSAPIADHYEITLWQLRIPRIVMSVLAGASLAICGGVFQSIFTPGFSRAGNILDLKIFSITSGTVRIM